MNFRIDKNQNSLFTERNRDLQHKNISFQKIKNKAPAFKGFMGGSIANGTFSFLQSSEILGPTAVDLGSMVIPRTTIDYTRGKEAGTETFIRETASFVNNLFMIGVYALGSGLLINKFLKIKANLAIDGDTIGALKNAWQKAEGNTQKYVKNVLKGTKYVAGLADKEEKILKNFAANQIRSFSRRTANAADNLAGKELKKELKNITHDAVKALGAEHDVRIAGNIKTNMKSLFKNIVEMHQKVFKTTALENLDNEIKKYKLSGKWKSLLGLGMAISVGFSTQFVNKYLTKLKTGSSAFVGIAGYEDKIKNNTPKKKNKIGFWAEKIVSVGLILYIVGASLAKSANPKNIVELIKKPLKLMNRLEFRGGLSSMDQLRLIYGAAITGRILASRDKNELRETDTRDLASFLNWLVLGGFVTTLTAYALAKKKNLTEKLFNGIKPSEVGIFRKAGQIIKNMTKKSLTEIDALGSKGVKKEEIKILKTISNKSDLAGLAYSAIMLGIGIPLLNKYITDKVTSKNPAKNKAGIEKTKEFNQEEFDKNLKLVEKTLGPLNYNKAFSIEQDNKNSDYKTLKQMGFIN